jgi:hypothetical protein
VQVLDLMCKTFDSILDDYAFFEAHSTEAEHDLHAYAAHLTAINKEKRRIHFAELPANLNINFDLILTNHDLYYGDIKIDTQHYLYVV